MLFIRQVESETWKQASHFPRPPGLQTSQIGRGVDSFTVDVFFTVYLGLREEADKGGGSIRCKDR